MQQTSKQDIDSRSTGSSAASGSRMMPLAAAGAGILLMILAYYARTWRSMSAAVAACPRQFCDFIEYYYPMGQAVFRTGLPIDGFLYSPFIAMILAPFGLLGLDAALVLWGILQIVSVFLYVLLFRRLVPARPAIQLLFAALVVSSYPPLLNLMAGSVSVFMMAAILGLLAAYKRGRRAAAAGLLALAVSFKFYPVIFLVPFFARRDIRFLLLAAAAIVSMLFVLPGALLGPGDTLRFYGALLESFRESDWVAANVHSQYLPHVVRRLAGALGQDADILITIVRWISFGIAAANIGLILLVQRARLRYADLWSFHLIFLTVPFILKTSWPHDFVFLSFSQALMGWWLLEEKGAVSIIETTGTRLEREAPLRRAAGPRVSAALILFLLSIVISNILFFIMLGDFAVYGFCAFPFWADLLLLAASYLLLFPTAVRRLRGEDLENGRQTQLERNV